MAPQSLGPRPSLNVLKLDIQALLFARSKGQGAPKNLVAFRNQHFIVVFAFSWRDGDENRGVSCFSVDKIAFSGDIQERTIGGTVDAEPGL